MTRKNSKTAKKHANVSKFISENKVLFRLPKNTIKDGADSIPTVQDVV